MRLNPSILAFRIGLALTPFALVHCDDTDESVTTTISYGPGSAMPVGDAAAQSDAGPFGLGSVDSGSGAVHFPIECRDQCELAGDCTPIPFEAFPDFDTTRDEWAADCDSQRFVVAGTCADGKLVLRRHNGGVGEMYLYDLDGNFLGLETMTDACDAVCNCRGYWPDVVPCESPVVTEVLCGELLSIGDPVDDGHWGG